MEGTSKGPAIYTRYLSFQACQIFENLAGLNFH